MIWKQSDNLLVLMCLKFQHTVKKRQTSVHAGTSGGVHPELQFSVQLRTKTAPSKLVSQCMSRPSQRGRFGPANVQNQQNQTSNLALFISIICAHDWRLLEPVLPPNLI